MPAPLHLLLALLPRLGRVDLPAPAEGTDEARRRAEEILARPEFREPPRSLVSRILGFFGRLLDRVFSGLGGGSELVAWIVVAVIALLLVALAVVIARVLQRDPSTGAGLEVDAVRRPPADWRADAQRHEAAGAWREALRCHWRALVADLAARGLVEEVPGRTTGEYRRHVARAVPGAAEQFSGATGLFEIAWYAHRDVDAADVAEERRLADQVLAEVRR